MSKHNVTDADREALPIMKKPSTLRQTGTIPSMNISGPQSNFGETAQSNRRKNEFTML
mgnify:CR=1 FL=1